MITKVRYKCISFFLILAILTGIMPKRICAWWSPEGDPEVVMTNSCPATQMPKVYGGYRMTMDKYLYGADEYIYFSANAENITDGTLPARPCNIVCYDAYGSALFEMYVQIGELQAGQSVTLSVRKKAIELMGNIYDWTFYFPGMSGEDPALKPSEDPWVDVYFQYVVVENMAPALQMARESKGVSMVIHSIRYTKGELTIKYDVLKAEFGPGKEMDHSIVLTFLGHDGEPVIAGVMFVQNEVKSEAQVGIDLLEGDLRNVRLIVDWDMEIVEGRPVKPSPSIEPTRSPFPTQTPTTMPEPTADPTESPMPEPTGTPSPTRSPFPTQTPTTMPEPSADPTESPMPEPTGTPSPTWSSFPTQTPSAIPTTTPESSADPTESPMPEPTGTPSPTRSPFPTQTPSAIPTTTPKSSADPTESPMSEPTGTPSPTRSPFPTQTPSAIPTTTPEPSADPAESPMSEPTGTPSPTRSPFPTQPPSVFPTESLMPEPIQKPTESAIESPEQSQQSLQIQSTNVVSKQGSVVVTGIKGKLTKKNTVKLQWKRTAGIQFYEIYRSAGNKRNYSRIRVVPGETTSYEDRTVKQGRYYYKIIVRRAGQSVVSLSQAKVVSIKVSLLEKPVIQLKKGEDGDTKYIEVILRKYGGNYAVIYTRKEKKYIPLKIKSGTISSYKRRYRFRYETTGLTLYFKVYTYEKVNGRKIRSPFSAVKRIKT